MTESTERDERRRSVLTVEQVAERLQVNRNTVYAWLKKGLLPHVTLPGGKKRVRESDLAVWLKERSA